VSVDLFTRPIHLIHGERKTRSLFQASKVAIDIPNVKTAKDHKQEITSVMENITQKYASVVEMVIVGLLCSSKLSDLMSMRENNLP